jgi:SAM-dependent methyltransferase
MEDASRLTDVRGPFQHDGGAAYVAKIDSSIQETDLVFLLENGVSIGRARAAHGDIRARGKGLFGVWRGSLYFSASDSSDCNKNGRRYQLFRVDNRNARLVSWVDNQDLLNAIAKNATQNNSFMINFFSPFGMTKDYFEQTNIPMPKSVLELGCAKWPFTAMRFLLEGTERYIGNDLSDIKEEFPPSFVSAFRSTINALRLPCEQRFDTVFQTRGDSYRLSGFEAKSRLSFDSLDVSDKVDFIHSTSVLEHVMQPEEVAAKMSSILPPGGLMFHSIDFRDHRNFSTPLEFLKLTPEEYVPIASENRLRASQWLSLIKENGFEILEQYNQFWLADGTLIFTRQDEAIELMVDERMRSEFTEPFRRMDFHDLSTLCVQFFCRKR